MYHELFDGQEQLPYHIFLIDAETEHIHAHTELEICFLLCGNADFLINHKMFPLYEHDFIITHPLALHQIQRCSEGCRVLFLQIDLFAFRKYISGLSEVSFGFSNIMNSRSHILYQTLYQSLRNILNSAFEGNSVWRLNALQEIINILSLLLTYYQNTPGIESNLSSSHDEQSQMRMLSILEYLNQNWQKPLTLASTASAMEMSPSYFSRFFKSMMGTGFLGYLTRLRLKRSLNLLLDTEMPIIEIALECGFNDYKTYGRLFKKEFGDNPQVYRKKHAAQNSDAEPFPPLQPAQVLEQLAFTPPESQSGKGILVPLKLDLNTGCPARNTGTAKYKMPFISAITVGPAAQILRQKVQKHILYAKKHIRLQSVRFFGLFSERLQVYTENADGTPCFNWEYLDEVFDFLYENQLSPFIVLDLMPDALSTLKPKITDCEGESIPAGQTCMPGSMEHFLVLIRNFISHYTNKYQNTDMLRHCRIQLWSFPESPESTWNGTKEQFFDLVERTYLALRSAAPEIRLGSPSFSGYRDFSMLKCFLKFCRQKNIQFDFFCLNAYSFTSPLNKDYPAVYTSFEKDFPYLDGDKMLNQSAGRMATVLSDEGFAKPLVVTEWGLNPYSKDLSRDTTFMAAWITEHMLHLSPDITEICYCRLTDLLSCGRHFSGHEFGGGQGLLTHSGIPKPSFSIFEMLCLAEGEVWDAGEDYLLTKAGSSWRLLLYNYCYYSKEYLTGKQELLFEEDRYNIYEYSLSKYFQIQIRSVLGKYRLETIQITREHCAPYDEWIKMGKPGQIDSLYFRYLMNKCCPGLQVETVVTSGCLKLHRVVPAHGITMVKIDKEL